MKLFVNIKYKRWSFFTLVFLFGCSTPNPTKPVAIQATPLHTATPPVAGTPQVLYQWPAMQSCVAPCWEGITPGITSREEALKILENNDTFQDIEIYKNKDLPKDGGIMWNWANSSADGELSFDDSLENPIINQILVDFPMSTPLKDLVKVYGNPSYAMVFAEPGGDIGSGMTYSIEFYYIDLGFSFGFVNKGNVFTKPVVSLDTPVNGLQFFAPSLDGLSLARGNDVDTLKKILIPWQGTFDFDTYCKLAYTGELADHCK